MIPLTQQEIDLIPSGRTYDNNNNNNNQLTFKDSTGYYEVYTYNDNGNKLTYKDSNGYCYESTYDDNGIQLTYKDSNGVNKTYKGTKMTKHKWYNEIIAFAEGKDIQWSTNNLNWDYARNPGFYNEYFYRVKPEIKADVIKCVNIQLDSNNQSYISVNNDQSKFANLILTFDGETKKLKLVEIVE